MKKLKQLVMGLLIFTAVLSFAKTHEIKMLNMSNEESMVFEPAILKIDKGDALLFKATDHGHNVRSVFIPEKAKRWRSDTDKEVTIQFDEEGIYIYECTNHSILGMIGMVQVGKPHNLKKAKKFLKTYGKRLVTNKNRIQKYLKEIK